MHLADLDYHLPPERIAHTPAEPRDSARLLVYTRTTGELVHAHVRDLPSLLPRPTVVVANNSKVESCRLYGVLGTGKHVEVLITQAHGDDTYTCVLGGARGTTIDTRLTLFGNADATEETGLVALVTAINPHPALTTYTIRIEGSDIVTTLARFAHIPLPPYIDASKSRDDQYQTIFATQPGSSAAPTAGLHITPDLIERLQAAGHSWEEITLHVGLGTFLPLRNDDVEKNILHEEQIAISAKTADVIQAAKVDGRPILAIGTTTTRTLESRWIDGALQPGSGSTNLFIHPGYSFKVVDHLLTNFHLPKSSLLLLVAAFIADEQTDASTAVSQLLEVYKVAIEHEYRFYSFGDAMLIL